MLSTKDITVNPGGTKSKLIEPGINVCKILKVELEVPAFNRRAYFVKLHLVTEDLGDDFDGFFIDKDNPDDGKYKGQVGRVRFSQYAFMDNTTKSGVKIDRDLAMMKALLSLCKELGCEDWFNAQDNKHETIEDLYDQFNADAPYEGIYLRFCIASQQYWNKEGYKNHDLFLPKAGNGKVNFEFAEKEESKLLDYNEKEHLLEPKNSNPKAEATSPTPKSNLGDTPFDDEEEWDKMDDSL